MDKRFTNLLRYEFFKSRGFVTKESGVSFLEKIGLTTLLKAKADEIEEFKQQKIMEFEEEFDKHEDAKTKYHLLEKEEAKQKKQKRNDMLKKSMKESMREELLKEIQEEQQLEKRANITAKYAAMLPEAPNVTLESVHEMFYSIAERVADKDIVLEPEQKDKLHALAEKTTQVGVVLALIQNELKSLV